MVSCQRFRDKETDNESEQVEVTIRPDLSESTPKDDFGTGSIKEEYEEASSRMSCSQNYQASGEGRSQMKGLKEYPHSDHENLLSSRLRSECKEEKKYECEISFFDDFLKPLFFNKFPSLSPSYTYSSEGELEEPSGFSSNDEDSGATSVKPKKSVIDELKEKCGIVRFPELVELREGETLEVLDVEEVKGKKRAYNMRLKFLLSVSHDDEDDLAACGAGLCRFLPCVSAFSENESIEFTSVECVLKCRIKFDGKKHRKTISLALHHVNNGTIMPNALGVMLMTDLISPRERPGTPWEEGRIIESD